LLLHALAAVATARDATSPVKFRYEAGFIQGAKAMDVPLLVSPRSC
jgi:hypothetical protein